MPIYKGTTKIESIYKGTSKISKVYKGSKLYYAAVFGYSCLITNLGASNPNDVVFTKTVNFPSENQLWEEVDIKGNKFAKFLPHYKKAIYNGNELIGFEIASYKKDNDFHIYDCFLDESGRTLPYILIGRYCSSNTSVINSVDNTRATMTIGTGRNLARALGNGYQIMDASMQIFWRDLALACSEKVDFNSGQGAASYLGLARMTEGGWWIDGLTHIDNTYLYCSKPSKYVDSPTTSTDGYSAISGYTMPTSNNWITKLGYDSNHPTINMPSANSGGSQSTYYCDYIWYNSGNRPCDVVVGSAAAGLGLFSLHGNDVWSVALGVRLCYKPIT